MPASCEYTGGRLTVRPNTVMCEILTDLASGRITGVPHYANRTTGACGVSHARAVVMCAALIESIRLLLNTRSCQHPAGLGISSGLLGALFHGSVPQPYVRTLARIVP